MSKTMGCLGTLLALALLAMLIAMVAGLKLPGGGEMTRRFNSQELEDGILPYQPREGCRGVALVAFLAPLGALALTIIAIAAMAA